MRRDVFQKCVERIARPEHAAPILPAFADPVVAVEPSDLLDGQSGTLALTPEEYANQRQTYIKSDKPKNEF